jgi:glycosyltransferase involved in cell wall biosynthesis
MRILQVGKFYFPYHGGIETVVQNLSEELQALGHEVTALVSSHHLFPQFQYINGVRVIRMGRWGSIFSQPLNFLAPVYYLILFWRADVIHLHSPNPLLEFFSLFFPGKKVVTFHAEVVRQKKLLRGYRRLQSYFFSSVSVIVTATKTLAKSPSLLGRTIEVIPFGIREKIASPEGVAEVRRRYGRYVLFVGRLVSYKGVAYLLEAMKDQSANLILIGQGPELANWQALSKQLPGKVFFLENVSEEELSQFYAACEVLVLPSISQAEAFGMVLIEAMSFGKPVISTLLGTGVDEVNDDGVTGLVVPPKDTLALARALQRILADEQLRDQLGKNARKKFTKEFSIQSMAEGYLKIYHRIQNA